MQLSEFERFFKSHYMPLGMYALSIVGSIDVAQDLVQESFIRAWTALGEDDIYDLKSWLYRCVRNLCIDYLRRNRPTISIDTITEPEEETIDNSEACARIWQAVDRLPAKCREIFLMSKRDGMSGEEIARELGISPRTVRNQISTALSRLREELSDGRKPFFLPFL